MSDMPKREQIFQISPKIISAELATVKGERLSFDSREKSVETPNKDDALLKLRSELITEVNKRSSDKIEFVLTAYKSRYGLIIPRGDRYLRLLLRKDTTFQELTQIIQVAQRLPM